MVSDKMDKTVVVVVEDRVKHPLYGKVLRRTQQAEGARRAERVRHRRPGAADGDPSAVRHQALAGRGDPREGQVATGRFARQASFRQAPAAAGELADIGDRRDSAGVATARRRQHGCPGDPVHPGARWLRSALREHRRRHRGHGQGRHPGRRREEGRRRQGGRRPHRQGEAASGRLVHPLRRERRRHHQGRRRPARHPHLRPGRPRAAGQAVHEDHLAWRRRCCRP